jgi:hypothetical protein
LQAAAAELQAAAALAAAVVEPLAVIELQRELAVEDHLQNLH